VENTILTAGGGSPGLGLRVTATYRQTNNVAWTLRSAEQVPLRSHIQDWPSGQIAWTMTPPKQNIGRIIPRILAQVTYRKSQTANEQPTFEVGSSVISRTTDEAFNPSVSLSLIGGILLTTDWGRSNGDRLAAGSLFHTERNAQNTTLTFAFRPPGGSTPRATHPARRASTAPPPRGPGGRHRLRPYVDSRQSAGAAYHGHRSSLQHGCGTPNGLRSELRAAVESEDLAVRDHGVRADVGECGAAEMSGYVVRGAWCVGLLVLACQSGAGRDKSPGPVEFNGPTAFGYVQKQMSFGPRIPNTSGHRQTGDWLLAELRARADTVIVQEIRHVTHKGDTFTCITLRALRPQPPSACCSGALGHATDG
jgi:hypothetical protein